MEHNKIEYIKLTKEQKEKCRNIYLYQDECPSDIWKEYCDILGTDCSSKVLKLNIYSMEELEY